MGSVVQAEVPGATIVSSSSNLYYLLWACSIILFGFTSYFHFQVFLEFLNFFLGQLSVRPNWFLGLL